MLLQVLMQLDVHPRTGKQGISLLFAPIVIVLIVSALRNHYEKSVPAYGTLFSTTTESNSKAEAEKLYESRQ